MKKRTNLKIWWVVSVFLLGMTPTMAAGTTIYVDANDGNDLNDGLTPETAFATIQKGIDTATDSDTVLVDIGVYTENLDFQGKAIKVKSTDVAENTIINGGGAGSCVKFISGETADAVLDGFTLTNGSGTYVNAIQRFGGGIYCYNSSNPTINNCIITGNSAPGGSGGGISCWYASATITNCIISENSNHGISNAFGSGVTVINCIIRDNYASDYGGGIRSGGGSSPTIINCTIVGNDSYHHSQSGIWALSGGTVLNCIVRDHVGVDVYIHGATNVAYSNVEGGYSGQGNIDADPLFVDAGSGDYHLLIGSPCIDAGDSNSVPDYITTDLDGRPRFIDDPFTVDTGSGSPPIVDMGTYEFSCGGDTDGNGQVDAEDFVTLFSWWLETSCGPQNDWCDWADSNKDGTVNIDDLLDMIENWLAGTDP